MRIYTYAWATDRLCINRPKCRGLLARISALHPTAGVGADVEGARVVGGRDKDRWQHTVVYCYWEWEIQPPQNKLSCVIWLDRFMSVLCRFLIGCLTSKHLSKHLSESNPKPPNHIPQTCPTMVQQILPQTFPKHPWYIKTTMCLFRGVAVWWYVQLAIENVMTPKIDVTC